MKQTIAIAFVVLASLLSTKAQNSGTAKELIALESRFSHALVSGDWKAVEQIEADDLLFTNADGSVTRKADDVTGLRSGDTKFESIDMSDTDVLDLGDVAAVTGKLVEKGRYKALGLGGSEQRSDVIICTSPAGQIEFLSICLTIDLQKTQFQCCRQPTRVLDPRGTYCVGYNHAQNATQVRYKTRSL